jgi:hypothetical protein
MVFILRSHAFKRWYLVIQELETDLEKEVRGTFCVFAQHLWFVERRIVDWCRLAFWPMWLVDNGTVLSQASRWPLKYLFYVSPPILTSSNFKHLVLLFQKLTVIREVKEKQNVP